MKLWITKKITRIYRLETLRCNCYLIAKNGHYILVDTSVAMERSKIKKQLDRLGVYKLDAIFLTHAHTDHVGNACYFSKLYGCKVYVHKSELEMITNGECVAPKGVSLIGKLVSKLVHKSNVGTSFDIVPEGKSKAYPFMESSQKEGYRMLPVTKLGKENDVDICIMETKGHTLGSVTIIVDHEVALVGDAMVHSIMGNTFPPFADGSEQEVLSTWKALVKTGCKLYCPAHGKEIRRQLLKENLSVYRSRGKYE